jgi:hypothetical protein
MVSFVALASAALAACGSPHASMRDAGTGGASAGIDAPLDLIVHEHPAEHAYAEAGPPDALGAPLDAAGTTHSVWTWTPIPESRCRDGSSTGIGVNLSRTSPNVVIFLDQGGACFNAATCLFNAASYDATTFAGGLGLTTGIFNRVYSDSPVREWNFVFVPYCTGDVHSGTRADGTIDSVGAQQFLGYRNLDAILARVVPTFANAQQVLLVGSSAGGFGALLNADHVARWFAPIPVTVVSDSGPPMPNNVVAPCLEQLWDDQWGFADGVLPDCGADCPSTSDYMIDQVLHFGWRFPSYRSGIISSTQDETVRLFFSFGTNDCAGNGGISPDLFQAGLLATRDELRAEHAPVGTYFIGGSTRHIWLMSDDGYAATVGGVTLKSWLGDLLAGQVADVGP